VTSTFSSLDSYLDVLLIDSRWLVDTWHSLSPQMKGVFVDEFDHFELDIIDRHTRLVELEFELDAARTSSSAEPLVVERTAKLEHTGYGIIGFRNPGETRSGEAFCNQAVSVVEEDTMSGNLKCAASSILRADRERERRAVFQSVNDSDRTGN